MYLYPELPVSFGNFSLILSISSANTPKQEKSAVLREQEEHLRVAVQERSHFTQLCQQSRLKKINYNLNLGSVSNTVDTSLHFSFDFVQQVSYPSDPIQASLIYFLTPRKCQIFSVHSEGIPCQVNYLIDESVNCGKGANVVISLVHHFSSTCSSGEKHACFNADNCS